MPEFDLAPGFVKLFYTSASRSHVATLPIRFDGTPVPGTEPQLLDYAAAGGSASTRVASYVNVAKALMSPTATFTGWEVYQKTIGGDPTFIFGDDLAIVGTNGGAVVTDSQIVLSFRTSAGSFAKIMLMDQAIPLNTRIPCRTTAPTVMGVLVTYLLSSANFIFGRDDGEYVSGIWITTKTNDALRRKRVLDA